MILIPFFGSGRPSWVQVDGVDLVEAAVDASCLEEEAVVWAGRHGVTAPGLSLQVLQQVKPWEEETEEVYIKQQLLSWPAINQSDTQYYSEAINTKQS